MIATSLSLTSKFPLLYRFVEFSRNPISNFGQQICTPANQTQIRTFRGWSSCSLYSYTLNYGHGTAFKDLGSSKIGFGRLNFDRIRVSGVSDGGSGGIGGGFGGSGDGNSGGRNEGDSGGNNWSFLSWYLARLPKYLVATKGVTSAHLTLIGDLICQLVIDQVPSLDLNGTFMITLLGLVLVGPILLFWVPVVLLAFDVSFVIFCIGVVCIFFCAIFCYFPIVAIAYAIATRQGASEDDIKNLPKYRYHFASPWRTTDNSEKVVVCGTGMKSSNSNSTDELFLPPEDSDCCICLSQYVEGAELYALPCNHHFHCGCISKWLQTNAVCPICKFSIRRGGYTLV